MIEHQCGWCGGFGHDESVHPEAVREMQQWQAEKAREESPFGDYREVP